MQEKKQGMGFLQIGLSVLFLLNPIVGAFDILPDFFGYLLLFFGTQRLADLNGSVEEARQRIRSLLFVGVGQLFAMYLLYVVMPSREGAMNPYEIPTGILLCAFLMLVFRCWLLLPAWKCLLHGLERLAETQGCGFILIEKHGETRTERLYRFCVVVTVLQSVLTLLPELAVLPLGKSGKGAEIAVDWYRFITLFRTAATAISIVVCIVALIKLVKFFFTLYRDAEWNDALYSRYSSEILSQVHLLTDRTIRAACFLLCIGMLFTAELTLDDRSVLSGVWLSLLALLAGHRLGTLSPSRAHLRLPCAVLMAVGVVHWGMNTFYLSRWLPEASLYQTEAYLVYFFVRILGVLEALATLWTVFVILDICMELVKTHTRVDYGSEDAKDLSQKATERLHREFFTKSRIVLAFSILATLFQAANAFLQLYYAGFWIFAIVCSFFAIWNFMAMMHELTVQVHYRYFGESNKNN